MSEPDSQCGAPLPGDAAGAQADKPRGGRLLRLGEAILEALCDLTSVIVALRGITGDYGDSALNPQRRLRFELNALSP
jgi:hypothetical protein